MKHPRLRPPHWFYHFSANVRDTWVLLKQFRGALLAFGLTIAGGGSLYYLLARLAGLPQPDTWVESIFLALEMMFLQANMDFPHLWYLQIFLFVMPLLGLGILGQGAADLGVLLFNRQARGPAWEAAVAHTYSKHIVLVGLGHVGSRIARELHRMHEAFVIIEIERTPERIAEAQLCRAPFLHGDATRPEMLRQAGVERARTIVIATNKDTANLQIAIHARALNPPIRSIVRLFDDTLAREVCQAFGITAVFSASALAAPIFAAAAAGQELAQTITVNGHTLGLSRVTLAEGSRLVHQSIDDVENAFDVSVVMHRRQKQIDLHPLNKVKLLAGDELTVFADVSTLHKLQAATAGPPPAA